MTAPAALAPHTLTPSAASPATAPEPLLRAEGVYLGFGGIQALAGVSLDVMPGEITAVIGPNGAGKTSLFNTLSGFYRPQRGRVLLEGRDLTDMPRNSATFWKVRARPRAARRSALTPVRSRPSSSTRPRCGR